MLTTLRSVTGLLTVATVFLTAPPLDAQDWARIVPGKTTREAVIEYLGPPDGALADGGTRTLIYRDVLDANELVLGFDGGGELMLMQVEPAGTLTETEVIALYGTPRKVIGGTAAGGRVVRYLLGGAKVEYDASGRAERISVTGGIATEGLSLEGVLRSLIGGGDCCRR